MPRPGVQYPVQINGESFDFGPLQWQERPARQQTVERMQDSSELIFLAEPWDGCPQVVEKKTWTYGYPATGGSDFLRFLRLAALPGFFDLCPWETTIETFVSDGVHQRFRAMRRDAIRFAPIPFGADTENPTIVRLASDLSVLSPTFDAEPDDKFRIGFSLPDLYAAGVVAELQYAPVYRVRVVDSGSTKTLPNLEFRTITFGEG